MQPGDPGYNSNTQHGLISALTDQSNTIGWVVGGNSQSTYNGNTLADFGTGQANTNIMIAQVGVTGGAANICNDYTNTETGTGVYNDWYLPSKNELAKIYVNTDAIGGFVSEWYWSSTESGQVSAWGLNVTYGDIVPRDKDFIYSVRAVRSF